MEFQGFLVNSTTMTLALSHKNVCYTDTVGVPKGPNSVFPDTAKVGELDGLAKPFHLQNLNYAP